MTQTLLPIRATTIRLRMRRPSYAPFFHQPQLRPFLKELLQDKSALDNEQGLWVEAVESGKTVYRHSDEYRFNLFCTAPAYNLFIKLLDKVRRLPHSYPNRINHKSTLLTDNLEFIGLLDYFTQQRISHHDQLFCYNDNALQRELDFWQAQDSITLRFTSPTRFKTRDKQRGKARYIRDCGQIQVGETERRICKALSNLSADIKKHYDANSISYQQVTDRLFWTDNKKTLHSNNKIAPFGGAMGDITLSQPSNNKPLLPLIILGQYTGIGERRGYGLGRYRLQNATGQGTTPPKHIADNHHQRICRTATLEQACYNMARKHPYIRKYIDHTLEEFDPEIEDKLEDKNALNSINLNKLAKKLQQNEYQASILQGIILRQKGRHPRPLAVPPLEDRIAQRAVVEIMGNDIDQLSTSHSYGYRRGISRIQAKDKILQLNRQGYTWFFETDIEEFFDLISHSEIENRLLSFFPDDPLIPLIMEWIKAPVQFDGNIIERPAGLPQGSPISPMLANLMLEDFDTDLEAAGMKLIRFADDFVILGKNEKQAQQAAQRAEQSLHDIGLTLNPQKTHLGQLSEGLDFLGYTILNDFAVEKKRQDKLVTKLSKSNIPTASWLAKLLDQQPKMLDELNRTIDKKYRDKKLSAITSTTAEQAKSKIKPNTLPSNEQLGTTLFITPPCKYLHQKNGMLQICDNKSKEIIEQQNWNDLSKIILIGRHNLSQTCQISALKNNISIHYCSGTGKYLGLTTNQQASSEGSELWLKQQQHYSSDARIALCRELVDSRIHNQIKVLQQRGRHDNTSQNSPISAMQTLKEKLQNTDDIEQIRGYEGLSTAHYFSQLRLWVPPEYEFKKRQKRPPKDPFNALLSLGYSILYSHTASILHIVGLYPWKGFYHQGYGRHLALASDLMEAYRHIIERTALTVLRSGQLKPDNFYYLDNGACQLTREGLRTYLTQLSSRMLNPVVSNLHPEEPANIHEQLLRNANQLIHNIRNPQRNVEFFRIK